MTPDEAILSQYWLIWKVKNDFIIDDHHTHTATLYILLLPNTPPHLLWIMFKIERVSDGDFIVLIRRTLTILFDVRVTIGWCSAIEVSTHIGYLIWGGLHYSILILEQRIPILVFCKLNNLFGLSTSSLHKKVEVGRISHSIRGNIIPN